MRLLCSSFKLDPISHGNRIIRKKVQVLFSKFKIGNWERGWSQVTFLNRETAANQFQTKVELLTWSDILSLYPRLRSTIFAASIFRKIAEVSS